VSKSGSVFGWFVGDINYDGKINIDDYGIIDGSIGLQTGTLYNGPGVAATGGIGDGVAAVPEPVVLPAALLLVSVVRRRRC